MPVPLSRNGMRIAWGSSQLRILWNQRLYEIIVKVPWEPHAVSILSERYHLEWLKESDITQFLYCWKANELLFGFEYEEDRTHFALRWA